MRFSLHVKRSAGIVAAVQDDAPLRLDASREELLATAAAIVGEAWRSFDQARPNQPPVDARLQALLAQPLPARPTPVAQALGEAARILDESLAQTRPRWFAFIGSSGLEVGVVADLLAGCFDVNLAGYAAAASDVEQQAIEWLGAFLGYPSAGGACTSGGMLSNLTALAGGRERGPPRPRRAGADGRAGGGGRPPPAR